jgi:hypothetical protein
VGCRDDTSRNLFEQFFRCDCEAVGDFRRAVEDFKDMVAQGAVIFARMSGPRIELDAAKAGIAFGADDVAFSHGRRLCPTMVTVRRRTRFTKTRVLARVAILASHEQDAARDRRIADALSRGEDLAKS